jgi:hypothetical protein
MSDRPILFSAEMVRAILDGRKTQTRRMVKPQPPAEAESVSRQLSSREAPELDGAWQWWAGKPQTPITKPLFCPYGKPGDALWVRETWRVHKSYDSLNAARVYGAMGGDVAYCVDYLATPRQEDFWGRGRPSIHMPRWASRITLRITDIRVERLLDISCADAEAEGAGHEAGLTGGQAREAFSHLWNNIKGPGAWEANPWVWVISFERVEP